MCGGGLLSEPFQKLAGIRNPSSHHRVRAAELDMVVYLGKHSWSETVFLNTEDGVY